MIEWKHDPALDSYKGKGKRGEYRLVRTYCDVSKAYFNDELIGRASGSHDETKQICEEYDQT